MTIKNQNSISAALNRSLIPLEGSDSRLPVLDEKKIRLLTVGHPQVMRSTSEAFLKYTPLILEELTAAVASRERQQVRNIIHKLKSSVSIFASTLLIQQFDDLRTISFTASPLELMERTIQIKMTIQVLYSEIIRVVSEMGLSESTV